MNNLFVCTIILFHGNHSFFVPLFFFFWSNVSHVSLCVCNVWDVAPVALYMSVFVQPTQTNDYKIKFSFRSPNVCIILTPRLHRSFIEFYVSFIPNPFVRNGYKCHENGHRNETKSRNLGGNELKMELSE